MYSFELKSSTIVLLFVYFLLSIISIVAHFILTLDIFVYFLSLNSIEIYRIFFSKSSKFERVQVFLHIFLYTILNQSFVPLPRQFKGLLFCDVCNKKMQIERKKEKTNIFIRFVCEFNGCLPIKSIVSQNALISWSNYALY